MLPLEQALGNYMFLLVVGFAVCIRHYSSTPAEKSNVSPQRSMMNFDWMFIQLEDAIGMARVAFYHFSNGQAFFSTRIHGSIDS
jgi:hypothetical protein